MDLRVSVLAAVALHKYSGRVLNLDLIVLSNSQDALQTEDGAIRDISSIQPFAKFSLN
jgi:hypothetical protein